MSTVDVVTQSKEDASIRSLTLGLRDVILNGGVFQRGQAMHLGLGPTDLIALGHVCRAGQLTPGELAQMLGLTTGSITPLVDRMQAAGFVIREVNPDDRRSMLVRTTAAGTMAMERFYAESDLVVRQALEALPHVQGTTMGDIFDQASAALRGHSRS
jgi:DNA-binding MarR family transcriptional regulator